MSILKNWYDGNLYPCEEIVSQDPQYRPVSRKVGEEREYFRKKLSDEDRQRFEEWDGLILQSSSMNAYAHFDYGFHLGAILMLEIMQEKGVFCDE